MHGWVGGRRVGGCRARAYLRTKCVDPFSILERIQAAELVGIFTNHSADGSNRKIDVVAHQVLQLKARTVS